MFIGLPLQFSLQDEKSVFAFRKILKWLRASEGKEEPVHLCRSMCLATNRRAWQQTEEPGNKQESLATIRRAWQQTGEPGNKQESLATNRRAWQQTGQPGNKRESPATKRNVPPNSRRCTGSGVSTKLAAHKDMAV